MQIFIFVSYLCLIKIVLVYLSKSCLSSFLHISCSYLSLKGVNNQPPLNIRRLVVSSIEDSRIKAAESRMLVLRQEAV